MNRKRIKVLHKNQSLAVGQKVEVRNFIRTKLPKGKPKLESAVALGCSEEEGIPGAAAGSVGPGLWTPLRGSARATGRLASPADGCADNMCEWACVHVQGSLRFTLEI